MSASDRHEPEIALVLSADTWVDDLHRHCTDHGGARVRCMVLDPAVALDEEFDVLVTSDRWPALTRSFVDALHARGRRVLVVGDAASGSEVVHRLGVDRVLTDARTATEVVDAVVALTPEGVRATPVIPDEARAPRDPDETWGSGVRGHADAATAPVIAVGGPFGAGSTEVAIALAAASARRGARSALVDADEVTPSVAARLGLPLEPNLCTAVDAAAYGLGAVPGALFDLGDGWPAVLVGAPNRRTAATLRAADVMAVGDVLAARFSPVVFDVSAGGGTTFGPSDLGAAVVRRAAVVVAVGAANPVGVVRLLEWLRDLAVSPTDTPIHVVVNRAPSGRARRAELAGELQREVRTAGLTFVPPDPRVEDAAWAASVVERGPFAKAIDAVHRTIVDGFAVLGDAGSPSGRG